MTYLTLHEAAKRQGKTPDDLLRSAAAGRIAIWVRVSGPCVSLNALDSMPPVPLEITARRALDAMTRQLDAATVSVSGCYRVAPRHIREILRTGGARLDYVTQGREAINPGMLASLHDLLIAERDAETKRHGEPRDRLGAAIAEAFDLFAQYKGRAPQWRELLPYLDKAEAVEQIDYRNENIGWTRADGGLSDTSFKSLQHRLTKLKKSRLHPD